MDRLAPVHKLVSSTSTFEQVVDAVSKGKINLSPKYQRDFVWDVESQKQFIQNMVNGLPFGSLIIQRDEDTDDIMFLECIDGKQRITAMHDFYQNKFSINVGGFEFFFDDLNTAETRKMNNLPVPLYYVYGLNEQECIKLFIDLNSSVPQSTEHMDYVKSLIEVQ